MTVSPGSALTASLVVHCGGPAARLACRVNPLTVPITELGELGRLQREIHRQGWILDVIRIDTITVQAFCPRCARRLDVPEAPPL